MCSYQYDQDVGSYYHTECSECAVANKKLEAIEDAMKHLMKILYAKQNLMLTEVHECITDICDELGLNEPDHLPTIRRSHSSFFECGIEMLHNLKPTGT